MRLMYRNQFLRLNLVHPSQQTKRFLLFPLLIIALGMLSACGGGGSSNSATGVTTSSTYALRINAGGNDYQDSQGRLWVADYGYNVLGTSSTTDAINGTIDDALYQSEHYHSEWSDITKPELEYRFNVSSGNYAVILHFAEITTSVNRVFDVEIEGQQVIDDLDIVGEAGRFTALSKNISTTVNDGEINIRFPRNAKSPKVSAIEILEVRNTSNASTTDDSAIDIAIPETATDTGKVSIIGMPENGTAILNGNSITYTANLGFAGQDTIIYSYVASNGAVVISSITVDVDSTLPNGPLIANPDNTSTEKDTAVNIPVLANDGGISSSVIVSIDGGPTNGNATVLANNTITYTPNPSYTGTDSFSYKVSVGGSMAIATVTVDVTCTSCTNDKIIGLSWDPSVTGTAIGYLVYSGSDANNVDKLLIDLTETTGLDPNLPYVEFSTQNDLQLNPGDNVCFRISAYKDSQVSDLSAPICGVI